jgi:predicted RNase H-like HicB family nuclease
MKTTRQLTAIIEREDDAYVALCPELDVASQGDTVESARKNLIEALELFLESADPAEIARRLHGEVFDPRSSLQPSLAGPTGKLRLASQPKVDSHRPLFQNSKLS